LSTFEHNASKPIDFKALVTAGARTTDERNATGIEALDGGRDHGAVLGDARVTQIVFIDPTIANYQALVNDVKPVWHPHMGCYSYAPHSQRGLDPCGHPLSRGFEWV
jgi:hypothetical protein